MVVVLVGFMGAGKTTVGRIMAERLGQPFVVVNRPGANTNLGTFSVVRAKADGYTLLVASVGLAANPSLYRKLAFEPQHDLRSESQTLTDGNRRRAEHNGDRAAQVADLIER